MDTGLERITAHRDKFQAWGSVLSVLSLLAAIWVTAPTLQVDIPLAAGAKASINAGYIIALGPAFIAFGQLWSFGSLVAMRQYQLEIVCDDWSTNNSNVNSLTLFGPLSSSHTAFLQKYSDSFRRQVNNARRGRSVVFFVIPVLAQIVILSHMFNNLMYFDKDTEILRFEQLDSKGKLLIKNWGIDTHEVTIVDTLFSKYPEGGNNYTLQNSGLNEFCGAFIYLSHLKKIANRTETQQDIYKKLVDAKLHCVPIEFPKFELALNAWLNIFMLVISVYVSWLGSKYYAGRGIVESEPLPHVQ